MPSTLITEVRSLLAAGEPFVYAYYDGIDKVAHEYGLGAHYEAELVWVDRLVGDLLEVLPPGAALLITADHGQVDVGDNVWPLEPSLAPVRAEPVRRGPGPLAPRAARAAPTSCLPPRRRGTARDAWVVSRDQILDEGWFGPSRLHGRRSTAWATSLLAAPRRRRLRRSRRQRTVHAHRTPRLAHSLSEMLVPLVASA